MINTTPFQHRNHNDLNHLCKIGEKKKRAWSHCGQEKREENNNRKAVLTNSIQAISGSISNAWLSKKDSLIEGKVVEIWMEAAGLKGTRLLHHHHHFSK